MAFLNEFSNFGIVKSVIDRWKELCLLHDGSLFSEEALWSKDNFSILKENYVENPIEGSDKSFLEKLSLQLEHCDSQARMLAAECLWILDLLPIKEKLSVKKKINNFRTIWELSGKKMPEDSSLFSEEALSGLVSPGQGFLMGKWKEYSFLISTLHRLKSLDYERRASLLSESNCWEFCEFVTEGEFAESVAFRHMLLFMVFPEFFESTATKNIKRKILNGFRDLVPEVNREPATLCELDRSLFDLRSKLQKDKNEIINFFDQEMRTFWDDNSVTKRRFWVEKTDIDGRPVGEEVDLNVGKALWSPSTSKDGRKIYENMKKITEGDIVYHLTDSLGFTGVSIVKEECLEISKEDFPFVKGTRWEGFSGYYLVELENYKAIEPPFLKEEFFNDSKTASSLKTLIKGKKAGKTFFDSNMKLHQGAYLTEAPKELMSILNERYKELNNKDLPYITGPINHRDSQERRKNVILYGPPGTGKTYSAIQYAVAIVEGKSTAEVKDEDYEEVFSRFLEYKGNGIIAFTTFHQSFSYEEFIEGIRPVVSPEEKADAGNEIEYEIHDGIFKAFCDNAGKPVGGKADANLGIGKNPTVWKVSLEAAGDNPTRTECMENNHIRIGWDEYGENISDATDFGEHGGSNVLNAFYNRMQIGDIILSCYSSKTIDAIGVVTGEPEWHDEYDHYKRVRNVRWLVKGINEDIVDLNSGRTMTLSTVYKLSVSVSDVLQMLKNLKPDLFKEKVKVPNRVFIIDEINRGNISKIFGELITLIESSKRIGASEQLRAKLPYSGQNFGVPDNVYIIGTMNTADRSIALIDSALRRRFSFVEMQPDSTILEGVSVENINIAQMLDTINKRITVLLDREHTIGHSYLLPLKSSSTIETLAEIFENSIMPLLQEYFYDDYEKIRLVLGDNKKTDDSTCFIVKKTDTVDLFGGAEIDFPEYYEVNREAFKVIEAYRQM